MRGVVVTPLPLPDPRRDRHGVYRRLGMFLQGIQQVCENIDIVHFARASQAAAMAVTDASAQSSAFWQVPVRVRLAPLNERQRSYWQTGSTPFTLRYRGDFRPYLGSEQASALGRILADGAPAMIFAHRLPAMTALMQLPLVRAPIFFDLDDIEHRVKQRARQTAASPWRMIRHALEVPALLAVERRSVARATRTFVCSSLDRSMLEALHFDVSRILVIPNALENPQLRPRLSPGRSVLFVGNYGYGPNAQAAERLINRIWPKVRARMESSERNALGRSRGGYSTKFNTRTNAEGLPIGLVITPGQDHDVTAFPALMQAVDCDPEQLLGDKGYDSDAVRQEIADRGGEALIPTKSNRKIQYTVDKAIYGLRNRIERFFNRLKNSRRVATRYDKLLESFAAFVILATIRIWIRFVHGT
jgi:transposase